MREFRTRTIETVRRKPIISCPDDDCPAPWVEFSSFNVTKDGIELVIDKVTGPAAAEICVGVDAAKERALEGVKRMAFDKTVLTPEGTIENHALAVTLEGELIFVPFSKQPYDLYAHLAFVDPNSGDADVLSFVPDPAMVRVDAPAEEAPAPAKAAPAEEEAPAEVSDDDW